MSNASFAIEIVTGSIMHGDAAWVRCEEDGVEYRAESRSDAECEARFSLGDDVEWRVIEVQS